MKAKLACIILIVLCIAFSLKVQAYSIENIFKDAQNFTEAGDPVGETINQQALKETSSFIYKLLLAIGVIVAFIVGVVLGIQFMVSSAEDKAKVKEALVAYTISCIVLFGAYGIWSLVVNMAQDVVGKSETTIGDGSGTHVHNWVSKANMNYYSDYVCSIAGCSESVRYYSDAEKCSATGGRHSWTISYVNDCHDIILECRNCHEQRSNNSKYNKPAN